jgi:replicative DNA helicase
VVAGLVVYPEHLDAVVAILPDASAFYDLAHGRVYGELLAMRRRGVVIDRHTVLDELSKSGFNDGPLVASVLADPDVITANVCAHAEIVAEKARRRLIAAAGHELSALAYEPGLTDVEALAKARDRLNEATADGLAIVERPLPDAVPLDVFLDAPAPEYDWSIPHSLEVGDRLVVTGKEGGGKSTLVRQIGLGASLGENTFSTSMTRGERQRVLLVDIENSELQVRRELNSALARLGGRSQIDPAFFRIVVRPDGLVLDNDTDPAGDRSWLQTQVANFNAQLLVIGPMWKMFAEADPTAEVAAAPLARFFDRLRARCGLTLVIEAHSAHNTLHPYGWSGWKRWPEFGFHLAESGTLTPWRGGRDESRVWPKQLTRRGRRWLWTPTDKEPLPPLPRKEVEKLDAVKAVTAVLNKAKAPLTRTEIIERADTRKGAVLAALAELKDEAWVIVSEIQRKDSAGRRRRYEAFSIDRKARDDSF